jgi:hypothetical protein
MSHDIRNDEPPFPALPEWEASVEAPADPPPLTALATQYEPEVFDLVRNSLAAGKTESEIIATLVSNDFGAEEGQVLVRAVAAELALAGDTLDREVFAFVSDHLDRGIDEEEIVQGVREFGLSPADALQFVRSVSAISLAEVHRPESIRRIADLEATGKSPTEIVEELEQQGLSDAQIRRLLRDRIAILQEIKEGRQEMNRAQIAYLAALLLTALGCFVFTIVFAIGPFLWAGKSYACGKKRVQTAESLLYPRLPAAGSTP